MHRLLKYGGALGNSLVGRAFSSQAWGHELVLQHPCKNQVMVVHTYIPNTAEAGTADLWGSLASQPSLTYKSQANERTQKKKKNQQGRWLSRMIFKPALQSTNTHAWAPTHILRHTHIRKIESPFLLLKTCGWNELWISSHANFIIVNFPSCTKLSCDKIEVL